MKHEGVAETEAEKKYWYTRWKDGFAWLEMADTLIEAAQSIHINYVATLECFLHQFWEKEKRPEATYANLSNGRKVLTGFPNGWNLYAVYMHMAGLAIENLFKGIIISEMWLDNTDYIDRIDDFEKLSAPLKGSMKQMMRLGKHGLTDLFAAEYLNLTYKDEEIDILKRLDTFILWGGRYPSPKKYDIVFQRTTPPTGEPQEYEAIGRIYMKARGELKRLSRLQWENRFPSGPIPKSLL